MSTLNEFETIVSDTPLAAGLSDAGTLRPSGIHSASVARQKQPGGAIIHLLLIFGVLLTVFPFLWMLLTSFKTNAEAIAIPPTIFPSNFRLDSYRDVFHSIPFAQVYLNTIASTVIITCCQLLFCAMAAYAFARIKFPGRDVIFVLILSVLMVPGQIFLVPQYLIVMKLGLLNTLGAIVLPNLFSAFGTFLLRQFFLSLPKELEEAAILDGCNRLQIFYRIMLPLVRSGLVALTIFTAKFAWNDFMWPLLVNTKPESMTLAPSLATLTGEHINNYPAQMAGAVMAVIPMVILFFIFQKQFIEGVAQSGVKG